MRNSKLVKHYFLGAGAIENLTSVIEQRRSDEPSFAVFVIDHYFRDNSLLKLLPILSQDVVLLADTTDEPRAEYIDELVIKVKEIGLFLWPL